MAVTICFRMAALPVNDDSEIDWKDLATGDLKLWSAHWLQKAWKKVERTAPDYENMPYKGNSSSQCFADKVN